MGKRRLRCDRSGGGRRYLDDRGVPLAAAQVQYSLLSKGPDQAATLQLARDLGVAVIAYSPLGLGASVSVSFPPPPPSNPTCFLPHRSRHSSPSPPVI